ncbi:MAG TPA: YibE/F family protein, partial [Candidatus Paceibacterota bacterium]|nr:YibE/F family protein [Candidatus Paceibacterota bacterium]
MRKIILLSFISLFTCIPSFGAEIIADKTDTFKARVLEVLLSETELIEGTNTEVTHQLLSVEPIEGELRGETIEVRNDYLPLEEGDTFYLSRTVNAETGQTFFSVGDVYRLPAMLIFVALFIIVVIVFGGMQGMRGLFSLLGSLLVIAYILFPGVLNGLSPVWLSIAASSLIIVLGSYITHGFNKTTSSAVIGMIITVLFTGFLAYAAVHFTSLTGFESEEAVYLNFNTEGKIDFAGLLLGGMIIGLLGVLYDAAIGQSVAVEELYRAGGHMSPGRVFKRAIRIGREHIGALVNTLAIAYVGASLPLLLLFYGSELPLTVIANKEHFAAEVVRTMVGSIGLVLAVPITTFIAVLMLKSFR